MKVTLQQTAKILSGNHQFKMLGLSMMITRMKQVYAKNPSQSTLQTFTTEINDFIGKFESIMGADYAIIEKL